MRFTAQEEYGLRCLLQIAREPTESVTIPEIARREGLTPAYVAKLVRLLRQSELVQSTRGQNGGYRLARPSDQISVGLVLTALGGRLYSNDFCGQHAGQESVCVHNADCSIRSVWIAIDSAVQRALDQMKLTDLFRSEQAMNGWVQVQIESDAATPLEATPCPGRAPDQQYYRKEMTPTASLD
jgi:Rrf2 family protein